MVEVVKLKPDGRNWSEWREYTQKCAELQRVVNYLAGTPPARFSDIRDALARRIVKCTVPKPISKHFRHYATARECIDYLTKRFDTPHQQTEAEPKSGWMALDEVDEATTYGTWELGERDRVGEKGETLHGSVDEAAAVRGPGTATTAETTDGVSLVTPASGPQQLVKLLLPSLLLESTIPPSLVRPPLPLVESNMPPKRTPPHMNESCRKGQQAADDDDGNICRTHATHAEPTTPASTHAAPRHDANAGVRDGM